MSLTENLNYTQIGFDGTTARVIPFAPARIEKPTSNLGKRTEVYPIKKQEHIAAISQYFLSKGQYRDLLIFTFGINIGLRAGDLLSLKAGDILNDNGSLRYVEDITDTSDGISVIEEKTSKHRTFYLNEACRETLTWYMEITGVKYQGNDYIFQSREGGHVEVDSYRKILKGAAKSVGIKQNIGTHTLRKTFGYWQFTNSKSNPRVLALLQRLFGHSSEAMTLRYIGLSAEEDKRLYQEVSIRTLP